jgi:hypothetical protein
MSQCELLNQIADDVLSRSDMNMPINEYYDKIRPITDSLFDYLNDYLREQFSDLELISKERYQRRKPANSRDIFDRYSWDSECLYKHQILRYWFSMIL